VTRLLSNSSSFCKIT